MRQLVPHQVVVGNERSGEGPISFFMNADRLEGFRNDDQETGQLAVYLKTEIIGPG